MQPPPPSYLAGAVKCLLLVIALSLSVPQYLQANLIGEVRAEDWALALPSGVWRRIHRMQPDAPGSFTLQAHGGSAFDSRRGRIVLFGSDTHGEDWSNAPRIFDVGSLTWRRLYPDDPPSSYRVNEEGLPVAGASGDRPWAMHSFGAVDYDPRRDAILVSSYPAHMEPGRFSDALAEVWPKIKRHPIWLFDLERERWRPLEPANTSFFAYATTYDSDRGVMVGTAYHGVFELGLEDRVWRKTADGRATGYHNNAVYDSKHKALVLFGRNGLGNDILVYRPEDASLRPMPTPGLRPPRDEHAPMAFHSKLGESLVLVDRFEPGASRRLRARGHAETWAYDLGRDRWRLIESASLPFALGMNYHLHYDPQRDVLLLVTATPPKTAGPTRDYPEVWALKL